MLTVKDLCERYGVCRQTVATWYAKRIIPEPIKIGGLLRWREEDVEAWEQFLRDRRNVRDVGGNPDAAEGPAPPVYSHGVEALDPRAVAARIEERERRERSKTLRAEAKPLPDDSAETYPKPDAARQTTPSKGP